MPFRVLIIFATSFFISFGIFFYRTQNIAGTKEKNYSFPGIFLSAAILPVLRRIRQKNYFSCTYWQDISVPYIPFMFFDNRICGL